MKEFSNRYIFLFSSVMVIAVATLLSLAATLLQPRQMKNLEIEKKKSMLASIDIASTRETTEALFDKYIKGSYVLNSKGEKVEGVDAFEVDMKVELKKLIEQQYLPVFEANPDDGEKLIILPVEGKGLWGPIYGYVSIKSDMNTIYGVTFDHKGETRDWEQRLIQQVLRVCLRVKNYLMVINLFQYRLSKEEQHLMILTVLMRYRGDLLRAMVSKRCFMIVWLSTMTFF